MEWLAIVQQALTAYNKTLDIGGKLVVYFQKAEEAGWFNKVAEDFKPLQSGPTTGAQKDEAAKAIANDIHKL